VVVVVAEGIFIRIQRHVMRRIRAHRTGKHGRNCEISTEIQKNSTAGF